MEEDRNTYAAKFQYKKECDRMKKTSKVIVPIIALVLAVALAWVIWGQGETYTIHITVPAGTMDEFVYIEDFIYSVKKYHRRKTS